jgi:hypothetical protein
MVGTITFTRNQEVIKPDAAPRFRVLFSLKGELEVVSFEVSLIGCCSPGLPGQTRKGP